MGVPLFCKTLFPLSHPACALPLCADARPCPDGWGKMEGGTAYRTRLTLLVDDAFR